LAIINGGTPIHRINRTVLNPVLEAFRSNVFIYPRSGIKEALLEEFRRIEEVQVSVKDLEELEVVIEERKPNSLWCGESLENSSNEKCYFIDLDGLIYSEAPNFSGNVFLGVYGEIENALDPIGEHFLTVSKYKNYKFFENSLSQYDLGPIILNKVDNGDLEIYLKSGGKILYNSEQDIVRLSENIGSILKDSGFKEDLNRSDQELEYIDLRFGNKVYYKFK